MVASGVLPPVPPLPLVPLSGPASARGVQTPAWQVPFEHVVPLGFSVGLEHRPVPLWQVPGSWQSSGAVHALTMQQTPLTQEPLWQSVGREQDAPGRKNTYDTPWESAPL
jgi:hypothetical protein